MILYRITFLTKGFIEKHFDSTANKATHYHVLKNNRKIAEHNKLKKAIESIIECEGENKELLDLIDHVPSLQNPESCYICVGITYGEKHGIKIEMKLK